MRLADANVILDFCALDPARDERARRTAAAHRGQGPLVVTEAVLAECFWVLQGAYAFTPAQSTSVLSRVLGSSDFAFGTEHQSAALSLKRAHPALDVTDCLLAVRALAGDEVATYDTLLNHVVEAGLGGATE